MIRCCSSRCDAPAQVLLDNSFWCAPHGLMVLRTDADVRLRLRLQGLVAGRFEQRSVA